MRYKKLSEIKTDFINNIFEDIKGIDNTRLQELQMKITEIFSPEAVMVFINGYTKGGGEVTVSAQDFIKQLINTQYGQQIQCGHLNNGVKIVQSFKTKCTFEEGLLQPIEESANYLIEQGVLSTCKTVTVNQRDYIVLRLSAKNEKSEDTGEYFIQPLLEKVDITDEEKKKLAKEMEYYYWDIIQKADQSTKVTDVTMKKLLEQNKYPFQIFSTFSSEDPTDKYYIPQLQGEIITDHEEPKIWNLFKSKYITQKTIDEVSVKFHALGYYNADGVKIENEFEGCIRLRGARVQCPALNIEFHHKIPYFFVHNNEQDFYPFCIFNPKATQLQQID